MTEYKPEMSIVLAGCYVWESIPKRARGLNDPDTKPRAQLDKAALEIVELLGYSSLPQKMYSLVLDELEALTSIMEHGTGDAETYADRGPNVLRQSADKSQRSLDKWTE